MEDSGERLRQHVETWKRAAAELARIHERELQDLDTREAVRLLFSDHTLMQMAPRLRHSGLVEQQAWFAKLRSRQKPGEPAAS